MNLTSLPDWLSSISSSAALLFAAIAAVAARNIYKIESARDQANAALRAKQDALERRDQAALVSAWWGYSPDGGQLSQPGWGVFVRNASETPVYNAGFSVLDVRDPNVSERFDMAVIPPAAEPMFHPSPLSASKPADFRVEVTFTDSRGQRWIRDKQGRLHELGPAVVVWGDESRINALRRFFSDFLASHGVEIDARTGVIEELRAELLDADDASTAPDIVVGPHDWIGSLVQQQLIEPLTLSPQHRAAFDTLALEAMTYQGELYGIPYAFDAPVLLRNTDLVAEAPSSFEDMLHKSETARRTGATQLPFAMQVPSPYYTYPVLLAAGGEVFGRRADGGLDTGKLEILSPATRVALDRFRDLGQAGRRHLRPRIGREEAIDLFVSGRTPFLIGTSRVLQAAQKAGLNFAVDPVPSFDGHDPVRPMVSVHGFFLTRRGHNKVIARDLIVDHLTRTEVSTALHEVWPHVPARRDALERGRDIDPAIGAFYEAFRAGDPMPSIPEMGDVWQALRSAVTKLVDGAETGPVARQLSKQLEELLNSKQSRGKT